MPKLLTDAKNDVILMSITLAIRGDNVNIRKFRMSAGLTQDVLAFKLGVKRQTISMWETGESAPKTEMLPEIVKTYRKY